MGMGGGGVPVKVREEGRGKGQGAVIGKQVRNTEGAAGGMGCRRWWGGEGLQVRGKAV